AVPVPQARQLPPLPDLPALERREAEAFEDFMASRDAGHPLALRDGPKAAAFRLSEREDALENLEAAVVLGDDVARARARLDGEVIVGSVANPLRVRVGPNRFDPVSEPHSDTPVLTVRRKALPHWPPEP